jgi:cytochrome c553
MHDPTASPRADGRRRRMTVAITVGVATGALLLAANGLATAQPPVDLRAAGYLAGTCAACHGTNGRNANDMPVLAGRPSEQLAQRMRDLRDGRAAATVMHQHAKGYTDAQIDALADYFSRQPAR